MKDRNITQVMLREDNSRRGQINEKNKESEYG
jgi:hypothetical protein